MPDHIKSQLQKQIAELEHELAGQTPALEFRVGAHAADFAQVPGMHALSGHRDEPAIVEAAEVFAQFDRSRPERARASCRRRRLPWLS